MKSQWARWAISIVFGIVVGRYAGGVLLPFLMPALTGQSEAGADPSTQLDIIDNIWIASLLVWFVVAIVVTIVLARIANIKRLIGWGCILLGVVVLSEMGAALLLSDTSLQAIVNPSTPAQNDTATAFFFWMLIMELPTVVVGLALAILGLWLVRKGRNEAQSGAPS